MPHLVILYTPNLDRPAADGGCDMTALCRALADTLIAQRDEAGAPVFPPGGVRVLAYPATHFAVADGGAAGRAASDATGRAAGGPMGRAEGGAGDYAFVYLNLRMGRGRSAAVHKLTGETLLACTQLHFEPVFARRRIGITLQIDEGQEVFDAKHSNLHPLFNKN